MTSSPLFKRVPVDATPDMMAAAGDAVDAYIAKMKAAGGEVDQTDYALRAVIFRAMLAAAPESPPATSDDLTSRLRALSRRQHDDLSMGDEAADEIETLRERVKELELLYRERTELAEAQRRRAEAAEAKLPRAKVSG